MTFGERLRYLREERELRQQDIAEQVNISKRMIGYYESDKHFPRDADMVIALAKFFDVSLDYLFGITDIRKNDIISAINKDFSELSKEKQRDVIDYIKFLKTKK
ncbi:MAG TPA: helix-turn-helix domain-containing protein [Candidatus Monoglobus merdigallinarum]|uniref:Helix-turn-helix domain-containing protein n=1 Tax=Candidatus Monoglobus merdigallinarum TaxID=2838698 RepID=A0A9D1PSQ9_9FIRM|nr:helix-turn-helix domain-containing protein [Candidatus Monoglobus merdigallinarum]